MLASLSASIKAMENNFNTPETVSQYLASDRWNSINRSYSSSGIQELRNSIKIVNTISEMGSKTLWSLLNRNETWISTLGAATVQQAVQMYNLNYEVIYVSGWQVAAESNNGVSTYPDLSLYPSNSTPDFVRKINNTLLRKSSESKNKMFPPIVADAESGFGGVYSVYELTSQFISAGISGIHLEDQLASEKKCGHMGGKVVIPSYEYIKKLNSARLASDVLGSPIVIIARTDALTAKLITSDFDEREKGYLNNKRTSDGYFEIKNNQELAITKSLLYAEYADVIWCETDSPDLGFAKEFANEIKSKYPNKILAYNCSPSFNWVNKFSKEEISNFQKSLFEYGYNLQFVSLAGFHSMSSSMYDLAKKYKGGDMSSIIELQNLETRLSEGGYSGLKHQAEVGANYFEKIGEILLGEDSDLLSTKDSTENNQF